MFNRFAVFTTMLWAAILSSAPNLKAQQSEVKTIVLVHGAWADGSGWRGVYDNLVRDGFNVSIVQQPETSAPGDYIYIPPGHAHFGGSAAQGPSVIQLHGEGPFQLVLGAPK